MIRVALIAHLSEVSGAGVALLSAAKGLEGADLRPILLLPNEGPLADRARTEGIEPVIVANAEVSMAGAGFLRKPGIMLGRLRYVLRLSRYLRAEADLACVNSTASIFAGIAARLAGLPVVWRVHELVPPNPPPGTRLKLAVVERLSRGIIYDSESGRRAFPAHSVPQQMVARNGTDVLKFANATRDLEWELRIGRVENTRVVISNGMFPRKAPDLFLQAASLLVSQFSDVDLRFVVVGEVMPEWKGFAATLEAQANRGNLMGRVIFAGAVKDMSSLLASADVYVSPARNEALPIALVEAMAAGVPVVATNVGDCARLLGDGKLGEVVGTEDPQALAVGIGRILNDPQASNRRAVAAQEAVLRDYAGSDFWKPLENFLLQAASLG